MFKKHLNILTKLKLYISWQQVSGTGPEGQIRADDVRNFVPSSAVVSAQPAVSIPGAAYMDIPLTSMRQVGV